MKMVNRIKGIAARVLFSVLLLTSFINAQTFESGSQSADLKASVRFRAFGNNNEQSQSIWIGNGSLSSTNKLLGAIWPNSPISKEVKFTSTDNSTFIGEVAGSGSASYTLSSSAGVVNYIQIEIKSAGNEDITVALNNIKINGVSYSGNSVSANKDVVYKHISGLSLSGGLTVTGTLSVSGDNLTNGNNAYVQISAGYKATEPVNPGIIDNQAPIVSSLIANPSYAVLGTSINVTAEANDASTGNSNIASAEYSLDGTTWHLMTAADGSLNSAVEGISTVLSGLACGEHTVYVRATDAAGNVSSTYSTGVIIYRLVSVSGKVNVGANGAGGVVVKLLKLNGSTFQEMSTSQTSTSTGSYSFAGLHRSIIPKK